jgi:hypothetical protein
VTDAQTSPVLGRTQWKRFALVMVPTTAAAGALTLMMAQGALAASFNVSGQNFKLTASELDGDGFAQFGSQVEDAKGHRHPVAVSAIREGKISNLCQSVKTPIGAGNSVVLTISAGKGKEKVRASNLVVDAEQLDGNAVFTNIDIGRDAGELKKGGSGSKGTPGLFGQEADHVTITNLKQTAWATTAGTFRLPLTAEPASRRRSALRSSAAWFGPSGWTGRAR